MRITTELSIEQNAMLGQEVINLHHEAVGELLGCSGRIFFNVDGEEVPLGFVLIEQPSDEDWARVPRDDRPAWWMTSVVHMHLELSDRIAVEGFRERVANLLEKLVGDIFLISNIARPGAIFLESGVIYINDTPARTINRADNVLIYAKRLSDRLGWPTIRNLTFSEVWNWARETPGFANGIGTGRVGRALGALSYLACRPDWAYSPADLMWGMIGLEALYAKGKEGLKAQLMDKSEVLLGPREAYKKRFSGMYDYRSRFVHGDLDLPFVYNRYSDSTFPAEAADCEHLATAMLLASIQELVVRGWYNVEFLYTVSSADAV